MVLDFNTPMNLAKGTVLRTKEDVASSGFEDLEDSKFSRWKKKRTAVVANAADIGLPLKGEEMRIITKRQFNAFCWVQYVLKHYDIDYLFIATFSMGEMEALLIQEYLNDGKIKNVEVLMSKLRNTAAGKKELAISVLESDSRVRLWYADSHMKLMSMRTTCGEYYSIEGSGNLHKNARIEQYVIDNDKDLFDFTMRWTSEMREFLKGQEELDTKYYDRVE